MHRSVLGAISLSASSLRLLSRPPAARRRFASQLNIVDAEWEQDDAATLKKQGEEFAEAFARMNELQPPEEKEVPKVYPRRTGVIAQKIGMIGMFDEFGQQSPVSILRVQDCFVTQVKTKQNKAGLVNLQVGAGIKKEKNATKALKMHCAAAGLEPKAHLVEFSVSPSAVVKAGTELSVMHFCPGQNVDVCGISNGKGFAGVMKRHGFKGMRASHGVSKTHRQGGSTGGCQDPGKVWKGQKMPGRMGGERVTVQSMRIVRIDPVRGLIYLFGSVPGRKGNWITLRDAIRKPEQVDELPFPTHTRSDNDPTTDLFAKPVEKNPFLDA